MTRFKLTLEYDGAPFQGWQRLDDERPSVQGALERALKALTGADVLCMGAGRTDAGVHALGQVAHVDIEKDMSGDRLRDALNALVRPNPIVVLEAEAAAPDFHARFDAVRRAYVYRIVDRRPPLALERGRAWWVPRALDAEAMHRAAQALVGKHDFTTFRDAQCQAKSPIRTLDRCDVARVETGVDIWCEARSFLHRQVRSMVGALAEVGLGKWEEGAVGEALAAKDRARCAPVAPADGLYLVSVAYN